LEMVSVRAKVLLAAAGFLLLTPLSALAAATPLGKNLAGEACQIDAGQSAESQTISCGSNPAAELRAAPLAHALPSDAVQRQATIVPLLQAGARNEGEEMTCADPQWLGGDDVLLTCTFESNGWPRIVLGSVKGGKIYRASGLPSMLPVLASAIAANS